MRMPHAFLACVCLLGATQPTWSQTKATTIPGYFNPATGEFTTHAASSAAATPQATLTGTSIFFREEFLITITNYDQPANAQAVCNVSISTADANGGFEDTASVAAVSTGGGWSCDVPILTLWTLKNPTTDLIVAGASVTIYTQVSPTAPPLYRTSVQPGLTLSVPANTATAVNSLSFSL
jgi:hypothetical protein